MSSSQHRYGSFANSARSSYHNVRAQFQGQSMLNGQFSGHDTQQLFESNHNDLQADHTYHAPPPVPMTTNSSFSSSFLNLGAPPQFFDHSAYPVQPYGYAMHHNSRVYAASHTSIVVPSHVSYPVSSTGPSFQGNQQFFHAIGPWQPRGVDREAPEHEVSEETQKKQAQDVIAAHHRLNAVINPESLSHRQPCGTFSSSKAVTATSPGNGSIAIPKSNNFANPRLKAKVTTTTRGSPVTVTTKPKQTLRATASVSETRTAIKPQAKNQLWKPGGDRQTTASHGMSERHGQVPRDLSANSQTYDSDDDAEGEPDEYFKDNLFSIANGIARKTPKAAGPTPAQNTQKLKITVNATNAGRTPTDTNAVQRIRRAKAMPTRRRKGKSKTANKRTSAPPEEQEQVPEIPDTLKGKMQADGPDDLLKLISFETARYNANPQRLKELESVNKAIARENITRGVRIGYLQRKLSKELEASVNEEPQPMPTHTRSSSAKSKRKAEHESPTAGRIIKPKSRKTSRTDGQIVTGPMATWSPAGSVGRSPNGIADNDTENLPDAAEPTPDPEGADTDAQMTDLYALDYTLNEMMEQPKLEKAQFVPKELSYLTRRIEKAMLEQSNAQETDEEPAGNEQNGDLLDSSGMVTGEVRWATRRT